MLDRASLLGAGLAACDRLGEDWEFRLAWFDLLTMARARRSWRRSFRLAVDELRESAGYSVSYIHGLRDKNCFVQPAGDFDIGRPLLSFSFSSGFAVALEDLAGRSS